jgi:hypothetical protein
MAGVTRNVKPIILRCSGPTLRLLDGDCSAYSALAGPVRSWPVARRRSIICE